MPATGILQAIRMNGGVDGTRTRGLCRDRVTWFVFSTTYKTAETAKVRKSHVRHRILWVGLWVEKGHGRRIHVLRPEVAAESY